MPDYAPSSWSADAAVDSEPALTPEAIEAVLQEFRGWLQQAADRAACAEQMPHADPEFSWQTLVAEFTALRQEVNLQTKAARAQLEQNADTLKELGETVGTLDQASRQGEDEQDDNAEILRPLLKTLVDVYDALALAHRQVQRTQTALEELWAKSLAPVDPNADKMNFALPTAEPTFTQSAGRRWSISFGIRRTTKRIGRALHAWWTWSPPLADGAASTRQVASLEKRLAELDKELAAFRHAEAARAKAAELARQACSSILVGYTMSLQRLERALAQQGLEPIDCVGEPFDPECMEVVEVVTEPGRQGTVVLEEVRRGYHWHGRLFRFAQVRVARPGS